MLSPTKLYERQAAFVRKSSYLNKRLSPQIVFVGKLALILFPNLEYNT